jgi:hypothetical protein
MMQAGSGTDPQDRLAYLAEKKNLAYGAREALQVIFERLASELYQALGHKWPDAADYFMVLKNGLDALGEAHAGHDVVLSTDTLRIKSVLDEYEHALGVSYDSIFDEQDFEKLDPTYLGLVFRVGALDRFLAGELASNADFEVVVDLDAQHPERGSVSLESFNYLELNDMRLIGGCLAAWQEQAGLWLEARQRASNDPAP